MAQKVDCDSFWLSFTPDESDELVRRVFERRYGQPPARLERDAACVKAGPVPEEALQTWKR